MAREEFATAKKHWKHWVVYSTITFLSFFVFAEFAFSLSFLSILSPSTLMFYFTPAGLFLGETFASFFASVLLFLTLFIILRKKVYVKEENGLSFKRSNSRLMLPFYIIPLTSLALYISLIPLELSNLLTYVIFLILFESFIEHVQVSDYSIKPKFSFKVPEPLKNISLKKKGAEQEKLQETLEELERVTKIHEEKQLKESIGDLSSIEDPETKSIVEDLLEVASEGDVTEEEMDEIEGHEEELEKKATIVKTCDNCGTAVGEDVNRCPDCGTLFKEGVDKESALAELTKIEGVGRTRAERLYENGIYSAEDIVEEGIAGLSGVSHIGIRTAKKVLEAANEKVEDDQITTDEITKRLEKLERELLKDE